MDLDYTKLIHLIFPPSPDEKRVASLPDATLTTRLAPTTHIDIHTLLPYRDPYVRAAIHLNKFHHQQTALFLLAECLAVALHRWPLTDFQFVPIPLSPKRHRKRGYNQVTEVLHRAQRLDRRIVIADRVLRRSRDTAPQTSLTRAARHDNVADAFTLTRHGQRTLADMHVILIDDVVTTGATLHAARHALHRGAPRSVQCLALAH